VPWCSTTAVALLRQRRPKLGLASSLQPEAIAAALERLGLDDGFEPVVSAEQVPHRQARL
jgi:beta-phosphoglucomutase-like phosphatase (HAD superfamily)